MKKKKEKKERLKRGSLQKEPQPPKEPWRGSIQDLRKLKAHFMIGDQVPMEMIYPIATTVYGFKELVLGMKNCGSAIVARYFDGIDDPNQLNVFAAGSYGEGDPLPDDMPLPRDSSPYAMFSVMKW